MVVADSNIKAQPRHAILARLTTIDLELTKMSFQPDFSAAPLVKTVPAVSELPIHQEPTAQKNTQAAGEVAVTNSTSDADPAPFSWLEPHPQFVVVLVGPEEVPFGIQKDLLCARSSYYRKHFAAQEDDVVESIVKLPDTPVEVFAFAQHFMYTSTVVPTDSAIPSYEDLVGVWKLGNDFGIDGLCDQTLKAMVDVRRITGCIPGAPLLVLVWKTTPEGCSIRELLLGWAAEYLRSSASSVEFAKSLPQEVLSELVLAMSRPDTSPLVQLGSADPITFTHPQPQRKIVHYLDQEEEDEQPEYLPAKKPRRSDHVPNGSLGIKTAGQKPKVSKTAAKIPRRRSNAAVNGENMEFTTEQKLHFCQDLLTRMLSGPGEPMHSEKARNPFTLSKDQALGIPATYRL